MGARFDAACVLLSLAEAAGRRGDTALLEARRDEALVSFRELETPRYVDRARALGAEERRRPRVGSSPA